jgi:uncharacterized protein (UPF0332 family)
MSWQSLLQAQKVKRHQTSRREIEDLRNVVERDLQDAGVESISADRRFATAYNAVLQLAKIVIACSGYRVAGAGHHITTFEALELAMGPSVSGLSAYFDLCRRKRNQVDYDCANAATESETKDLIQKAEEFRAMVEAWIRTHHRAYAERTDAEG